MYKKILFLLPLMLLSACASDEAFVNYCPNVSILPHNDYVTKVSDGKEVYKVKLVGYEGYCRNKGHSGMYAVVSPIFEIIRLAPTYNNEVAIDFYADTSTKGLKSTSKQQYAIVVEAPKMGEKFLHIGESVDTKLPANMLGFKINLGLSLNKQEYYNSLKQGMMLK